MTEANEDPVNGFNQAAVDDRIERLLGEMDVELKLDYQALKGDLLSIARSGILKHVRDKSAKLTAGDARKIINAAREGKSVEFHPTSPAANTTTTKPAPEPAKTPPTPQKTQPTVSNNGKPKAELPVNQKSRAALEKERLLKLGRLPDVKEAVEVWFWLQQLRQNPDVKEFFELATKHPELFHSLFTNKEGR